MNKTLSNEIMKRSNLGNEYLKSRNEEDSRDFLIKDIYVCLS